MRPGLPALAHVVLATAFAFVSGGALHAQAPTGTVEGRVTMRGSGRPLGEVQVSIAGTTRGTRTDESGRYRLNAVPVGTHRLRAQRLGYSSGAQDVTVTAGATSTADFVLAEAALSLDAVVVTGTAAESRKKEVGNAMATLDAKAVEMAPVRNTQDILSARAPGITVLGNSGQTGSGGTIRLRGTNSVTQGNAPIVYVDGVRIYSDAGPVTPSARQTTLAMNDIKAEDIERIEIVKGAAATTLYGTEASGGVIQIFTKRGTAGQREWTVEAGGGANFMGHVGPASDKTGLFLNQCRGDGLRDTRGVPFVDRTCPESGSWLRNGPVQRYSVGVRGGGENLTYYLSTNFNSEEGVIPTNRMRDGGFRGNFSFSPARNFIVAMSSFYNKKLIRWVPDGNLANGFFLNVARGPNNNFKGGKGQDCADLPMIPDSLPATPVTCVTNRYVLDQVVENDADHFISGLTMTWSPTSAFTNRVAVGWDYNASDNHSLRPFGFINGSPNGDLIEQQWNHTKLSLDYAGSFQSRLLRWSSLASTFSWGGQMFDDRERFTGVQGFDFSGPGTPTLASAARITLGSATRPRVVNAGVFLQEMVGWQDRAFLTLGLRVDGNSAFGSNFGLQQYPKVSLAYVLSEESFWPTSVIPTFKLRAALGDAGKAPGAFDAVKTWDPVAGDDGKPAVTVAQRGNPDLGPERTRELEVGFDLGAFGDRVGLEATAFEARTKGALIGVTYPPSEGYTRTQLENVGTLRNRGLEMGLNGSILRGGAVDWQMRLNLTALESEVVDVGGRNISTGLGSWVREGYPVGALFGARITNPDAIADPVVAADQFIGPVYPTRIIGLGTTIGLYERLSLDLLGEFQGGAYLTNFIGYQNALRGIWQPCYDVQAKLRAAAAGDASALNGVTARDRGRCAIDRTQQNSDFWISKTDFYKLRNVSLAYEVPGRFVGGRRTTLTVAGRNLFKSTKFDGADPEANDASDAGTGLGRREYYQLPSYKSVIVTIRSTF